MSNDKIKPTAELRNENYIAVNVNEVSQPFYTEAPRVIIYKPEGPQIMGSWWITPNCPTSVEYHLIDKEDKEGKI